MFRVSFLFFGVRKKRWCQSTSTRWYNRKREPNTNMPPHTNKMVFIQPMGFLSFFTLLALIAISVFLVLVYRCMMALEFAPYHSLSPAVHVSRIQLLSHLIQAKVYVRTIYGIHQTVLLFFFVRLLPRFIILQIRK